MFPTYNATTAIPFQNGGTGAERECIRPKTETELNKYQILYLHVWYTGFLIIESSEFQKPWEVLSFQFYHLKHIWFLSLIL